MSKNVSALFYGGNVKTYGSYKSKKLLLCFCSLFFSLCFWGMAIQIRKGECDEREYRYLVLENGLKVVLVHDKETQTAGVAMDVYCGGRDDGEVLGLAHFLEHLLFMGTEKYPDEKDYHCYISHHGGATNGFTSYEHTNYFFEISATYLEGALDRFSQFFISPLLRKESVDRERLAVDSEYKLYCKEDAWRLDEVVKQFYDPTHPASLFYIGNNQTLQNPHKDVIALFNRFYSSENMGLCIYSHHQLSVLEEFAKKYFGSIPKRAGKRAPSTTRLPLVFEDGPKRGFYKTELKDKKVRLLFQGPPEDYRKNPTNYIEYILTHKGKGGLFSTLYEEGLITEMKFIPINGVTQKRTIQEFSLYELEVTLTQQGENEVEKVFKRIFQRINKLRQKGVDEKSVLEWKQVKSTQFRFLKRARVLNYASNIASNISLYSPEDVLCGDYFFDTITYADLQEALSLFTPNKCLFLHITPTLPEGDVSIEPWYKTEYISESLPISLLKELEETLPEEGLFESAKPVTILPTKPVIPAQTVDSAQPTKLKDTVEGVDFWHCPEKQPLLGIALFYSGSVFTTPAEGVCARVLTKIIEKSFYELFFMGNISQITSRIELVAFGVSVEFSGPSEKLFDFAKETFNKLKTFTITDHEFLRCKTEVKNELLGLEEEPAFIHCRDGLQKGISENYYTGNELLSAIDLVDSQTLRLFWNKVKTRTPFQLEGLFHGDCTEDQAHSFSEKACSLFTISSHEYQKPEIFKTLLNKDVLDFKVISGVDSSVIVGFQVPISGPKELNISYLLHSIIRKDFFDQLRTKEQLGYVCGSSCNDLGGCVYFNFCIQSENTCKFLDERIWRFIQEIDSLLTTEITEEQLQEIIVSRKKSLEEKETNLSTLTSNYFKRIKYRTYDFDYRRQQAALLEEITLKDIKEAVSKMLLNSPKAISVYVEAEKYRT